MLPDALVAAIIRGAVAGAVDALVAEARRQGVAVAPRSRDELMRAAGEHVARWLRENQTRPDPGLRAGQDRT